ncbi:Kazrin-A [Bagarius yarrelli]|uniref:Kazrin-A n=1 Tax=Bagarius yarrelli TaxID=175774 RepID=A0A556U8J7_BAGYA|nr:Kazrin-A [Bagarius yarrelli]
MQQLYATLESREEQLRDFIRNYEQHRKMSNYVAQKLECQLFVRAPEKPVSPRNMSAKQSLATLTKDVPKRHSLAMPTEAVVNGNQEWVMHAEMPLTAAIRQSQHSLYHTLDRHEDLEDQKRRKKKEKMGLSSLSRVFARGKQRKSLDPGLFDGTNTPEYYIEEDADW